MPVRESDPELDFETREYVQGKKITRTVAQWKESDRIIAEITDWNNEIEKLSLDLQKELRDEYSTDGIKVTPWRYNKLTYNVGFEKFVPRNYLSFEALKVDNGSEILFYYFGRFLTTDDLVETLKQDIYVKRKPAEDTGSNSGDTGGDGDRLQ